MVNYETLLLPLFYELRKWGMPLGVPDYLLAIEALHARMGLTDTLSLKRLCVLLWAKSQEDQEIVDHLFSVKVEPYLQSLQKHTTSPVEDTPLPPVSPLTYPDMLRYEHEVEPVIDVLTEHIKNSAVLIISDAGAARGHYDGRRVADTKRFIKTLSAYTYLYSWVNPLPASRWRATTAEDIACIVPMYPLTREGLIDAFTILQGHPFPSKVGIYE